MAKFEIFKSVRNNQFYFHLKATGNNEVVLSSEGYIFKDGCKNGIQSVKTNASFASRFERKLAINGRYYFVLKAANGEIIGVSQMYISEVSRDHGIEVVKLQAPIALVDDLS